MLIARTPLRLIWGEDSLQRLGAEINRLHARRPMLLHTRSLAGSDLMQQVQRVASPVAVFGDVRAHSPIASVLGAAKLAQHYRADCLVGVGGGSVSVTTRATAVVVAEGDDIAALATHRDGDGRTISPRLLKPKLPIISVPTTPSTAHCKAGMAMTVPGQPTRFAIYDPKTRAASILLDPIALATAPAQLVRDAALNAFVMAAEGTTTRNSNVIADADLVQALWLLGESLPRALDPEPVDGSRMNLALAAVLAGTGTNTAGGGLTAALSHTIGHNFDQHNGLVDAILLPKVMAYMHRTSPLRLDVLARALSCSTSGVADKTADILATADAPHRLRDLGVPAASVPELAAQAMDDFAARTSGSPATSEAFEAILGQAW